jgi:hypothetical protein
VGKIQRQLLRKIIWLLLFCLPISAFAADKATLKLKWLHQDLIYASNKFALSRPAIALTAEEQEWLQANPVIRVHNEKDWPLLQSALMKAMAAVTPQEMAQIRQTWVPIATGVSASQSAVPISYQRLMIYGLMVFL